MMLFATQGGKDSTRYHPIILLAVALTSLGLLLQCSRNHRGQSSSQPDRLVMESGRDTVPSGMTGRMNQMIGSGMRGMMQRMMPDMLPPGITPGELPDRNSRGAKLLIRYCTNCHNLPSPVMHSAEEWPEVTERMFRRMGLMRGMMESNSPSPEEQKTIVSYLKEHALISVSEDQLTSLQSEGARLFKQTCTQCHALPDPGLHTPQEWEQVIERMQGYMERMNKNVITAWEKNKIVDFLKKQTNQNE